MATSAPAGIPGADWLATPASVRYLILAQKEEIQALRLENDELRNQLTALATELASLRERIGRSSRNSYKPPSSDWAGFKPPERRKGSGRKRGGQPGHPGSGPEPLPIERGAFHQRASETPQSIPDPCAEKRTFACQQVLLSRKWPIASHPNARIPMESTAAQWIWPIQQALLI